TPELIRDPYPMYRRLQAEAPVYLDPYSGELLVTRYPDVVAALKHPALSSRRVAEQGLPMPAPLLWAMRPVTRMLSRQMLFSDPPDHTRLRSLATRAFTPRVVEAMRARIQEIAERLLDAMEGRGPVDLIGGYAAWLPVMVIAEMLGAELTNRERIRLWSDDLALFIGGSTQPLPVVLLRGARGVFFLRRYFRKIVRRRRGRPGDDLLGALLAAEERGDTLTEEELLANCVLLLAAGHETTTNLIGNGALALLRNPEELDLLRREPELIESAVEELLRYDSPVQWTGRVAVEELEIAGHRVAKGQTVAMGLGAANRDPAQFREPERLDLRRAENRHVAFG
ncbi:MAG TPA: cytochrome P450, partial [Armatimonadota bacterium]|nr:cytochrome P450 [Armatimonadota bacterium]